MDANMTNVSDGTQPYATIKMWTDFQYSSELVTEANSLDSVKSVSFEQIFTAIFVGFIILSNTISLVAFLLEKRLRSYNNYFIINLTILDLLVGIGLCPYVQHIYGGRYPFSHNACKILSGLFYGIVNASNINIVVICADRHQSVYDPINHFISRSTRKAVIINSLPWVIGLSFWIGYITVWEFVTSFDNGDHCIHRITFSPVAAVFQGVFMFYLPIFIISILYIRILIKIRKSAGGRNFSKNFALADTHLSSSTDTEMTSGSIPSMPHSCLDDVDARSDNAIPSSSRNVTNIGTRGQELSTKLSARMESTAEARKATRTLLFIVIAFFTTSIPGSLISLIYSISRALIRPGLSRQAFLFFTYLQYGNSVLNPISYALSQPLFRATVAKIFYYKH